MANVVKSLFGDILGPSPEEIQQQISLQDTRAPLGRTLITRGVRELGSLFGIEDPALVRAKKVRQALSEAQSQLKPEDLQNPDVLYPKLIETFKAYDLPEEALQLGQYAIAQKSDLELTRAKTDVEIKKAITEKEGKKSNLEKALDNLSNAEKALKEDPTNESLKLRVKAFGGEVDKLSTEKQSTDAQYAEANATLNDPNATADQKKIAQQTIDRLYPIKATGMGQYQKNPETGVYEPIPGTPAAEKAIDKEKKEVMRINNQLASVNLVDKTIDKAISQLSPKTTGLVGVGASKIPGTDAYTLKTTLNTVVANLGFDKLQAMRDASPTGGALGQVAVKEIEFLQQTIASLDQGLTKEELAKNLAEIKASYARLQNSLKESLSEKAPAPTKAPATTPASATPAPAGGSVLDIIRSFKTPKKG
jgi:hypothetical protein